MAVLPEANFASIDDLSIPDGIDRRRIERLRANGHAYQADIESDPKLLRIAHIDKVIGEYKFDQKLQDVLRELRTCTSKKLDCAEFSPENALLDIEDAALASGHFGEILLMHTIAKETGSTIWMLLGVVAGTSYILAQQYDGSQPEAAVLSVRNLRNYESAVVSTNLTPKKQWKTMRSAGTFEKRSEQSHRPSITKWTIEDRHKARALDRKIKRRRASGQLYLTLNRNFIDALLGSYFSGIILGLVLWSYIAIALMTGLVAAVSFAIGVNVLKKYAGSWAKKPTNNSER